MYRLGLTKLALDEAVAGEDSAEGDGDEKAEKTMKTSLLSVLREQFEREEQRRGERPDSTPVTNDPMDVELEKRGDPEVILIE
jgi:SWI/SNF-related matrix-associated actin-dependent regulator 1 of chromatin subfamily A